MLLGHLSLNFDDQQRIAKGVLDLSVFVSFSLNKPLILKNWNQNNPNYSQKNLNMTFLCCHGPLLSSH